MQITEAPTGITPKGAFELEALFVAAGVSKNKNLWGPDVLRAAVPLFKGAAVYIDHPTYSEELDRPERSLRDLAGVISDARFDSFQVGSENIEGVGGTIRLASTASWVVDMYREGIAGAMSIVALADGAYTDNGEVFVIQNVAAVPSVDFVTRASARGQIVKVLGEADVPRTESGALDLARILFMDSKLGQAIQVSPEGQMTIVESVSYKTPEPVVELVGEPEAATSVAEVIPSQEGNVVKEATFDDVLAAIAEMGFRLSELASQGGAIQMAIEELREKLVAVSAAPVVAVAVTQAEAETPIVEIQKPAPIDTGVEESLKSVVMKVVQESGLPAASQDRIIEALEEARIVASALTSINNGKPLAEAQRLLLQRAERQVSSEVQYLEEVAGPRVTGLGPDSNPKPRPGDLDSVFKKYNF